MARTTNDVWRSISRYFSQVFPEYNHYLGRREGDFERPAVVVKRVGETLTGRQLGFARPEKTQPFVVYIYPEPHENLDQSEMRATQAEQTLCDAIDKGVGVARWMRLPLWDFDGIGLDEPLVAEDEDEPDHEFVRVVDFGCADPVHDEEDPTRWTLVGNLRVTWLTVGRQAPDRALVAGPPIFTRNGR